MQKIIFFLCLHFLSACTSSSDTKITSIPYRNLAPSVKYVGMETCKTCHGNIHTTFQHTGMGKSFAKAHQRNSDAIFDENALVYEENSDFYYWPYVRDSLLYVTEFRLAKSGDTLHQRTEKISYIVGSGHHTHSHIIDIYGYIYQAPITYYTQDKKWDMAPSYREKSNLRFSRDLNAECITCHNHFPILEKGASNKFSQMPSGIECERCHGPGELHVAEKYAGKIIDISKAIDYSIVNPAKLPRNLQLDLCQRCHLQGTAVLVEGKNWFDFKPGMALHEVFNVYLPRFANSNEKFIMASQADRLRQSKCFQHTALTCLTCHNPHVSVTKSKAIDFQKACLACHQTAPQKQCTDTPENIANAANNCTSCHMPKSKSIDIAHVNITDHKIQIPRAVKDNKTVNNTFYGLEILTKSEATPIEMAQGYLALYDKYIEQPLILDSVAFHLQQSSTQESLFFDTQIHYLFNKKDYSGIIESLGKMNANQITKAWTAYRIAEAFYFTGAFAKALSFIKQATSLQPLHLDFLEKEGVFLLQLKQYKAARLKFDFILMENPKRPVALCNLGFLHASQGNILLAEKLYDKAIALNPDYEQALLNKAAVRNIKGDTDAFRALIQRVLNINPANEQAKQLIK